MMLLQRLRAAAESGSPRLMFRIWKSNVFNPIGRVNKDAARRLRGSGCRTQRTRAVPQGGGRWKPPRPLPCCLLTIFLRRTHRRWSRDGAGIDRQLGDERMVEGLRLGAGSSFSRPAASVEERPYGSVPLASTARFAPMPVGTISSVRLASSAVRHFGRRRVFFAVPAGSEMAEGVGVEPTVAFDYARFRIECLKPLSHPSFFGRGKTSHKPRAFASGLPQGAEGNAFLDAKRTKRLRLKGLQKRAI